MEINKDMTDTVKWLRDRINQTIYIVTDCNCDFCKANREEGIILTTENIVLCLAQKATKKFCKFADTKEEADKILSDYIYENILETVGKKFGEDSVEIFKDFIHFEKDDKGRYIYGDLRLDLDESLNLAYIYHKDKYIATFKAHEDLNEPGGLIKIDNDFIDISLILKIGELSMKAALLLKIGENPIESMKEKIYKDLYK